jgi:hypothetical protein
MSETTRVSSRILLEGPIELPAAAAALIGLLLFFFMVLWYERRFIGARLAFVFLCLRGSAATIAIWMLLAASSATLDRSETPRTIALQLQTAIGGEAV